jgi:cyanophycinase
VAAAAVLLLAAEPATAQTAGSLVIIGGGSRPWPLMERIVELAGGSACRMVVVPVASAEPLDTALYQKWQLERAGCRSVSFVRFDRASADDDSVRAAFDGATGVFLSGGDQRRLAAALQGTRLLERIHEIRNGGGVVAGTSAGAAVMSAIMITGDEIGSSEDATFDRIAAGVVATDTGFGFVDGAIVDQHFVARQRQNRLLSLVLEHPDLLGIGIDEATAVELGPSGQFRVLGEGSVVVYDAAGAAGIRTDTRGNLGAADIRVHVLLPGDSFDLRARAPLRNGAGR